MSIRALYASIFVTTAVIITASTIPIIVLGALILSWVNRLPSSDHDTVIKALGNNFHTFIVYGLTGSSEWILGAAVVWRFPAACAVMMMGAFSWLLCVIVAPWKAEHLLSPHFDSIPGLQKTCHEIIAMSALVLMNFCGGTFHPFWLLIKLRLSILKRQWWASPSLS
ncbi:hypothetical protein CPB84DRAFT_1773341 [Gymnopilus junonius]|uniref:Uncharacterized protein n=1 Tax=Gymnopilus junonius TaxID=109634 RepID=A0A9P5NRJ5_GYMJU|nr:hypothetical protein CPB84DRAFT_1773341 [Gymnopilus junonius]